MEFLQQSGAESLPILPTPNGLECSEDADAPGIEPPSELPPASFLNPDQVAKGYRAIRIARSVAASLFQSRVAGEGAWVATGQIAAALGALVGTRLLTEYVPAEVFGVVSLFVGLNALGNNMACMPLLQAAVRFYPDAALTGTLGSFRRAVVKSLAIATAMYLAFMLVGGLAAQGVSLENLVAFSALAVLFVLDTIRSARIELLTAGRRRRLPALWMAVDSWARPILTVALVLGVGGSPSAVLIGYATSSALVYFLFLGAVRRADEDSGQFDSALVEKMYREVWYYALPLIPAGLVSSINLLSDRYVISGVLGVGAAGIYAAAYGLVSRPYAMVFSIIETTLRPIYYDAVASDDKSRERRVAQVWVAAVVLTCGGGTLLFALFSRPIVGLLLSRDYAEAGALFPWIALGQFFLMLSYTCYRALFAYKRTRPVFAFRCLAAILAVGVGTFMTMRWGLAGTAMACPIVSGIELVALFTYCRMRSFF